MGGGGFVVAENGSGEVTRVDRSGRQRVLVSGAGGVSGVANGRHHLFAVLGGPHEEGQPPPSDYPLTSVLRAGTSGRHVEVIADLLKYELRHNPDGQVQLVDGKPVDALSNPNEAVFVSEVLHGAPEGAPPPGFDPASVGRITKIWRGHRTYAQVMMANVG